MRSSSVRCLSLPALIVAAVVILGSGISEASQQPAGRIQQSVSTGSSTGSGLHVVLAPMNSSDIAWQVIAGGATKTTSLHYVVQGTAGQTAIGEITSTGFRVNQGFWQVFNIPCKAGDANGDNQVDISDAVFLLNFIFKGGAAPSQKCLGDTNGDGIIDIGDVVDILAYIFKL